MRAVIVSQPGSATLARVQDPAPLAEEVIVKVSGCGICGTDLHILHEGLPNLPYPIIPGHEPWGEVVAIPRGENRWRIGDRVAVDPLHSLRSVRSLSTRTRQSLPALGSHWRYKKRSLGRVAGCTQKKSSLA